jgi:hypothetical protein
MSLDPTPLYPVLEFRVRGKREEERKGDEHKERMKRGRRRALGSGG